MFMITAPGTTPALGRLVGTRDTDTRDTQSLARVWSGPTRGLDLLAVWRKRCRQRAALAALDDWLLRDIGLTRADIIRECAKPFWQS
jgi:uncharacterized protein YjiS (DUF1127 family)